MAGGVNHSRPTSLTYPNGKVLSYNYGSGLNDATGRLTSLSDSSEAEWGCARLLEESAMSDCLRLLPTIYFFVSWAAWLDAPYSGEAFRAVELMPGTLEPVSGRVVCPRPLRKYNAFDLDTGGWLERRAREWLSLAYRASKGVSAS